MVVPGRRVAAMEAHVSRLRGGCNHGLDHVVRRDVRRIHSDIGEVALAQAVERLVAQVGREPIALAKLDQQFGVGERRLGMLDALPRLSAWQCRGWQLKEHTTELAGLTQRLERACEAGEDAVSEDVGRDDVAA